MRNTSSKVTLDIKGSKTSSESLENKPKCYIAWCIMSKSCWVENIENVVQANPNFLKVGNISQGTLQIKKLDALVPPIFSKLLQEKHNCIFAQTLPTPVVGTASPCNPKGIHLCGKDGCEVQVASSMQG